MDIAILQTLIDTLYNWGNSAVRHLPRFLVGLFVLFFFIYISKKAYTFFRTFLRKQKFLDHNPIVSFLARLIQIFIIIGGTIIALGIMDLDKTVTSLLAGAGVVALALGFAFQDLAENFIAGILLAVKQPCTVGDIVRVKGVEGIVQRIDIRETILHSFSGHIIIIPNKEIINNVLENVSGTRQRRVLIECGVSYNDDLELVKKVAIDAVKELSVCNKQKEVFCFFNEFGGSSINFSLFFWIKEADSQPAYLEARHQAIMAIKKAFDAENISIPYPTRTIINKK